MSEENEMSNTASLHSRLQKEKTPEQKEAELLEHPSYIELQKKLNDAETKVNEYWDKMLRIQAETDNAQRRMLRDIENAHKYALEKFMGELLPIIDSLELGIAAHANEDKSKGSLLDGVQLMAKMLYAAIEKFGATQVNPEKGAPFNPEIHQAVSAESDPSVPPGTVIKVLQKGYLLNNRLLRPAMVTVCKT